MNHDEHEAGDAGRAEMVQHVLHPGEIGVARGRDAMGPALVVAQALAGHETSRSQRLQHVAPPADAAEDSKAHNTRRRIGPGPSRDRSVMKFIG